MKRLLILLILISVAGCATQTEDTTTDNGPMTVVVEEDVPENIESEEAIDEVPEVDSVDDDLDVEELDSFEEDLDNLKI